LDALVDVEAPAGAVITDAGAVITGAAADIGGAGAPVLRAGAEGAAAGLVTPLLATAGDPGVGGSRMTVCAPPSH
jgi:hypothetical protein